VPRHVATEYNMLPRSELKAETAIAIFILAGSTSDWESSLPTHAHLHGGGRRPYVRARAQQRTLVRKLAPAAAPQLAAFDGLCAWGFGVWASRSGECLIRQRSWHVGNLRPVGRTSGTLGTPGYAAVLGYSGPCGGTAGYSRVLGGTIGTGRALRVLAWPRPAGSDQM
jgi:hypothetical protein